MEHMKMLFMFVGGLGMFLYGMNVIADGLQKSAGNRMRKLLQFLTSNRLMGVLPIISLMPWATARFCAEVGENGSNFQNSSDTSFFSRK